MSLTTSAKSTSMIPPLEPGTYSAICYGIIDLGMQYSEVYGKSSPKVLIMWEIPGEKIEVDGEFKSRAISKQYTNSLSEKANLRKDLEAWRGKAFTKEELDGFDLGKLLNVPCLLTVIHSTNPGTGKTYTNVAGVAKMLKGVAPPARTLDTVSFDLDTSPLEEVDALPAWIADKIKASETYQERLAGIGMVSEEEEKEEPQACALFDDLDDDDPGLPF